MSKLPKQLAIVLHCRTKNEYVNAQSADKVTSMKRVIEHYKLPITIDVLPSFEE